jgi:hypothetical protein
MKTHEGMKVQLHTLLTSALDGREWLASCCGRFTPGEKAPPRCSGWYEVEWTPEQISDVTAKRKILPSARNQTLVAQPITSNYNERAIPTLVNWRITRIFSKSGLESSTTRPLWGLLAEVATLVGSLALLSNIHPNANERLQNRQLFEHLRRRILWFFEDYFAPHTENFSNALFGHAWTITYFMSH